MWKSQSIWRSYTFFIILIRGKSDKIVGTGSVWGSWRKSPYVGWFGRGIRIGGGRCPYATVWPEVLSSHMEVRNSTHEKCFGVCFPSKWYPSHSAKLIGENLHRENDQDQNQGHAYGAINQLLYFKFKLALSYAATFRHQSIEPCWPKIGASAVIAFYWLIIRIHHFAV